eukprot:scaffold4780_cov113-Cylindrotheca_fusiformis.AAC.2
MLIVVILGIGSYYYDLLGCSHLKSQQRSLILRIRLIIKNSIVGVFNVDVYGSGVRPDRLRLCKLRTADRRGQKIALPNILVAPGGGSDRLVVFTLVILPSSRNTNA